MKRCRKEPSRHDIMFRLSLLKPAPGPSLPSTPARAGLLNRLSLPRKLQAIKTNEVKVLSWEELTKEVTPVDPVPPKPEDVCTIMYTSGTTGAVLDERRCVCLGASRPARGVGCVVVGVGLRPEVEWSGLANVDSMPAPHSP